MYKISKQLWPSNADIDNYNVAETHDQLVQMLSNLEKNIYNGARRTI